MTIEEVRKIILNILADIAPDEDISCIDDNIQKIHRVQINLIPQLGIVMELRKRFNIEVPEKDYEHLATMAGCVSYLTPLLKDRPLAS